MKRVLISIVLTSVLGLYGNSVNAASFVAGTGTQAGTVTDSMTNLMWQQCSGGLSGATCSGTAALLDWEAAITYCEGLSLGGFTDWRLPNVKELKSISDMTKANPAIDDASFPNTITSDYWSSTSLAAGSPYAWYVAFSYGDANRTDKTYNAHARCVRGQ
jgi:hypothetical protein